MPSMVHPTEIRPLLAQADDLAPPASPDAVVTTPPPAPLAEASPPLCPATLGTSGDERARQCGVEKIDRHSVPAVARARPTGSSARARYVSPSSRSHFHSVHLFCRVASTRRGAGRDDAVNFRKILGRERYARGGTFSSRCLLDFARYRDDTDHSRTLSLGHRPRIDSPLEEAGFELSVPRDTTKLPKAAQFASARFPVNGKLGASENRNHEDAGCLPPDRWFESRSLQRRVSGELGPGGG
jgi:hypothetical protein